MEISGLHIIKASGEKVIFSKEKVVNSIRKVGADEKEVQEILEHLKGELYEGISTKTIYNRAFNLLKKRNSLSASKYKLKKAIYELGPTGFPFEHFIAAILKYSGYKVEVGKILQGKCVTHEVDVIAKKDNKTIWIECKFHNKQGQICNVKAPLYVHSRFMDIENFNKSKIPNPQPFREGWLVTNTRFTTEALKYGKCANLYLLSWDYPFKNGLKDRIDQTGLYPITVSILLTAREKQFLLSRDVVLCRELIKDNFYLDHLEISGSRKTRILNEMEMLCHSKYK